MAKFKEISTGLALEPANADVEAQMRKHSEAYIEIAEKSRDEKPANKDGKKSK